MAITNTKVVGFGKSRVVLERCRFGIAFVEPQSSSVLEGEPGVLYLSQLG
jgi:hypothetical protein